jgi:uncharacterized protein with PIN domain
MTIRLYFDEDSMDQRLVRALRVRGMDARTALDENMIDRADEEHLDFATQQERVLFSFNRGDFYALHTQYLSQGKSHAGMILVNQQHYSVGEQMRRILRLSAAKSPEDMQNWIEFLSAWG